MHHSRIRTQGRPTLTCVLLLLLFAIGATDGRAQTGAAPACPKPAAGDEKPWLNPKYTPQCRAQFVLDELKTLARDLAYTVTLQVAPTK
jgi:hypothetical protein